MRKVLIALEKGNDIEKIADELLSDLAEVVFLEDVADVAEGLADVEVLVVFQWKGVIGKDLISRLGSLRFIQTLTAGVNHIPFEEIPSRVIVASNSGANAEYIAGACLCPYAFGCQTPFPPRRAFEKGRVQAGCILEAPEGAVLGLLGLGSIGRVILRLGRSFGMKVCAIRKSGKPEDGADFVGTPSELPLVLRESDYLVIALSLTRQTEGLIGEKELSMMKKDAVLVNISRGKMIDQEVLYRYLSANPEFTACLDVWWGTPRGREPFRQDFPFEKLPNVIMTPHVAPLVHGHFENMVTHALENVRSYLSHGKPSNLVDREDYIA